MLNASPMPNPARRAVALAALAVAIIAAAVALDLSSIAAQSDEQTGRIVAQRLADGRTEFGWQPANGARVLPRARYFPADAQVDRWLNSSSVEVGGEAIGRINARLRDDGRIEFAFTPTDGERILPPSRYFPADVRVGRWLRSTEIAISAAPTTGFVAISAGYNHNCAIRESREIECWGGDHFGQSSPPAGSFSAVSTGALHTCAIRDTAAIECWGADIWSEWNTETEEWEEVYVGQTDAPTGSFSAVNAGILHTCAIRDTGAIECWGRNDDGESDAPTGSFAAVSAGERHTCAIRESGAIECWGSNSQLVWDERGIYEADGGGQTDARAGSFSAVSAGNQYNCAIRAGSGAIECWGSNAGGGAPTGSFTAISAGHHHSCAIRESGAIECWGSENVGETKAPPGRFTTVSAAENHSCAIREDGAIECWGHNRNGLTDAPAP